MKPFTQRWREASDEAEDQPMEDIPTDPKEAQDVDELAYNLAAELEKLNPNDLVSVNREKLKAIARRIIAAQIERADRLKTALLEAEELIDGIDTHAGGLYGSAAALERIKELRKSL